MTVIKSKNSPSVFSLFFRLWNLFYKEAPLYFNITLVLSVLSAAFPFVLSRTQGIFVDSLVAILGGGGTFVQVYNVLLVIVVAFSLASIVDFLFDYYLNVRLFYNIVEKSCTIIMKKKSELDLEFFDNSNNISLLNQSDDAERLVAGYFVFLFRAFFISLVSFVVSIVVLLQFSVLLVCILLVSIIPFVWVLYSSSTAEVLRWKGKTLLKKHTGTVRSFFGQVKYLIEIKIYDIAGKMMKRYESIRKVIDDELVEISKKYLYRKIAGSIIRYTGLGFVMMLLARSTMSGEISIGQATFYLATIFVLSSSAQSLFSNLARARQELLQISTMFDFLDVPVKFSGVGSDIGILNKAPSIEFLNVTFGYNKGNTIISNASFTINPGEKIAIVGLNGAGKTTLVKLLCRVYDPDSGMVKINGEPLAKIDPLSWYRNLSVVFQDYGRYEFLAKESIALSEKEEINIQKVKESAKMANISLKIEGFEKQYDTQLGTKFPGGEELSVGQWQKLAIARALYRQSKVIILDEPTSSVDADAEEEIFNTLHKLAGDTTLIFVSHRFSTIRQADKIIFVANAGVEYVGSHDDLMQNSLEYKRLYDSQYRAYVE